MFWLEGAIVFYGFAILLIGALLWRSLGQSMGEQHLVHSFRESRATSPTRGLRVGRQVPRFCRLRAEWPHSRPPEPATCTE